MLEIEISRWLFMAHPAALFALYWAAFKKPPWAYILHIFETLASNRHEKGCQLLERILLVHIP